MVSKATNAGAVTVSSILDILSRQLEVAECDVFGYLNVESDDLVILVRPVVKSPTMLQVSSRGSLPSATHSFSRRKRSKSPHRDRFVCRPSGRPSVCHVCLVLLALHVFCGTLVCAFVEPAK